ncbi:Ethionine resistance-conferring protein 1 [Cladophialophora carrionii]|uniref:Ethionine resistance-conferring protein 1 n=1 Tax=Cladophialophora carrionii TaxID=86049 RepID=A0A1C1C7F9_9EURO|nr:Ethionine resistance-conferring protein 1 [Cladophialophora carrionii]
MTTPPKNLSTLERVTSVTSRAFSRSLPDFSPIAQASLARDIEEDPEDAVESESEPDSETSTLRPSTSAPGRGQSSAGLYRRPSFVGAGNRATVLPHLLSTEHERLSKQERKQALEEERSLLRDNNIIPPKHPQAAGGDASRKRSIFHIPGGDRKVSRDEEATPALDGGLGVASEATPLLGDPTLPYGGQDDPETINQKWEEAVAAGMIHTTWQREAKVIARYAAPLMVTFILQYSLTVASIFTVGHIGTVELGAVSLASMSANITGYAIYQGLATSLDTLCAQAYGSGRRKLVGLQMQRMIYFLWTITLPIAIIWIFAENILVAIVPEPEVAKLAGLYLKVVLAGAPGYAAFEAGKRYVQAQGLFSASLYVLLFCAPFNAFMNWLFVWRFKMGFVGAPIAVAITDNLLPIGLFIYVRFFSKTGMSCWNGFTKKALQNWGPMVKLALPGVVMIEAEVLAFEILTFAASYFGTTTLAAQSVLATLTSLTFQIPFPLSIAGSTRVANLIGATLADAAKVSTKVTFSAAVIVGILNVTLLSALKDYIPRLFTSDAEVIRIVSDILPLCAAFQLFDALAAACNGILRGLGRQEFGGYVQLFCYYVFAMPISFGTAFGAGWGLWGLWTGVALALGLVAAVEFVYLARTDWNRSVEEATARNMEGGL